MNKFSLGLLVIAALVVALEYGGATDFGGTADRGVWIFAGLAVAAAIALELYFRWHRKQAIRRD